MNKRQKIIISITGITLVLLILVGLTYAYFLTRIQGNTNTKSISVTTADLKLVYGDGNGLISAELIQPGTTLTTKTFTVNNTGNSTVEYGVFLEDLINTFERTQDLKLTVTCTSSVANKTCSGYTGSMLTRNDMLLTNSIEEDEVQSYELTLNYVETGTDQSVDMNKQLEAKVQIYGLVDTVDLSGTVTDAQSGDYVVVNSDPKKSQIVNGKYKVVGLLPGTHTISVYDSGDTKRYDKQITIQKGNKESISGTTITVLNDTRYVVANVSSNSVTPSLIPYEEGTLAYAIINSAKTNANGTTYRSTPLTKPAEEYSLSGETCEQVEEERNISEIIDEIDYIYISNDDTGSNGVATSFNSCTNEAIGKYIYDSLGDIETSEITGCDNGEYVINASIESCTENIERILSITRDDYGTSYYYRGTVEDNYVNFAGMCWKIVRIEGDGSVKLVLASKNGVCESNINFSSDSVIGYQTEENIYNIMNTFLNGGTTISYTAADQVNVTDTENITYHGFGTDNLAKLNNKLICETDESKVYDSNGNLLNNNQKNEMLQNGEYIYYDTYKRLAIPGMYNPSLMCNGKRESYNKISLLSADENVYAGYSYNDYDGSFDNYYLYYISLFSDLFMKSNDTKQYFNNLLSYDENGQYALALTPTISLIPNISISGGDGTKTNPYVIN